MGTKKRLTIDADANGSEDEEEVAITSTMIDLTEPVTTMDITSDEGGARDDSWDFDNKEELLDS